MNNTDLLKNRQRLASFLEEYSVAILFAGQAPYKRGDEKYPFSPDRNFYYVTGIEREDCIFLLAKTPVGLVERLYIPRDNGILAKWVGANMTVAEAQKESGIADIAFVDGFETDLAEFLFKNNTKHCYLDLECRDWEATAVTGVAFAKRLREKYPAIQLHDVYPIFGDLRLIKQDWELERMRKAMAITAEGFYAMMRNARPDMMEYEMEAHFDYALKKRGVQEKAFATIAAGGKRGTILHYVNNCAQVKDGELLLVDAGAQHQWYNGDISRTFPVNGRFSDRQKLVYEIVLEGHRKVMETIRPDVPFARLNEVLKEHYLVALKELGLVETKEDVAKYYYHGVSHFLGAETHDIGRYVDRTLQPGMVLTVEPGLYIEEWEIGIRIEDDVLVTEDGCENMTKDMIRTVAEIEDFMAEGK